MAARTLTGWQVCALARHGSKNLFHAFYHRARRAKNSNVGVLVWCNFVDYIWRPLTGFHWRVPTQQILTLPYLIGTLTSNLLFGRGKWYASSQITRFLCLFFFRCPLHEANQDKNNLRIAILSTLPVSKLLYSSPEIKLQAVWCELFNTASRVIFLYTPTTTFPMFPLESWSLIHIGSEYQWNNAVHLRTARTLT